MTAAPRPYTWDQLRRLSLARQFPKIRGRGLPAVAACVDRVGPMQTQTARSAFLGLAARLPGVGHATLTRAYEEHVLVRGSTIRGTVHTSTPLQHVWLDRATRVGQRAIWARTLALQSVTLDEVWAGIEEFATPSWRGTDELSEHLLAWLQRHGERGTDALGKPFGRYLAFGHGGLVRRPATGGWEGQETAGYRWVDAALAAAGHPDTTTARTLRASPHAEAMAALALLHLRCHGPATRHDIAGWAGIGLREVDAALAGLGDVVDARPGPGGQDFWDLVEDSPAPVADVGTRLLPEFDAVVCGYHPTSRDRFLTPEQHAAIWNASNGLMRPPLLHDGRVAGWWRLSGTGRRRRWQVRVFDDSPQPTQDELATAATAAATALDVVVDDLEIVSTDAVGS